MRKTVNKFETDDEFDKMRQGDACTRPATGPANRTMTIQRAIAEVGIVPRLLTREQAAAYCGISLPTFKGICPVRPIALGASKRLERYDLRALEQWIDTFSGDGALCQKDWLATLDAKK